MEEIKKILNSDDLVAKKTLFSFSKDDPDDRVLFKYNLWIRYHFPKYFTSPDAPFHEDIDRNNLEVYRGKLTSFVDLAFRGAAKTSRTKLFLAFCIANDQDHYRRYIKVNSWDGVNSTQIVTDIYNMLISPKVALLYPEIFEKTVRKREERMGMFTTSTGVKMVAATVSSGQRGALQDEARPDLNWFEDFENRKTLHSAKTTIAIWDNMEEARTALSKDGGSIYTANYISEQGNVHKLVSKTVASRKTLIIPIIDEKGETVWERYSKDDIELMRQEDDDFEGERLCKPSASKDIYFDRETLDNMKPRQPIKVSAGFKIFHKFDPSHRYASGHDIGGGVGLDSSTSVFIDFDTNPARVVGTFADNTIKPEAFGHEVVRELEIFGDCLCCPENKYGTEAILVLKQADANLFIEGGKDKEVEEKGGKTYGWNTNTLTKPKMLSALAKAVADGLIDLSDENLIAECKGYTRNDLIENIKDPRLTTRHFDLLIACAIAWQMKDYAELAKDSEKEYDNVVDSYISDLQSPDEQKVYSDNYFDKYFPNGN